MAETSTLSVTLALLFPTESNFSVLNSSSFFFFLFFFITVQAAVYVMYLMLDSHFWVFYLPVAKGANPAVYLGQYLKQRSKLYKPIVIMLLRREFWSTLMLLLWEIIVPLCDFIRSPGCFKRCSLWRLKATSLADSIPRGWMNKKKRRDYNEIELAMTRIGLFIIPLAGEGERASERRREGAGGTERDKADRKKCVVAGPALAICHEGSSGRQSMHAYHCHGYQRGLLSGDFAIKAHKAHRACSEVRGNTFLKFS